MVFCRNLGFSVRPKPLDDALLPDFCKPSRELMSHDNRKGHEFRSLVACKPIHHSLVASALLFLTFFLNALCYICALAMDAYQYSCILAVNPEFRVGIAYLPQNPSCDSLDICIPFCSYLSCNDNQACCCEAFDSNP